MGKIFTAIREHISRWDTLEARKEVAVDLIKVARVVFGLALVNAPGQSASICNAIAAGLGYAPTALVVSPILWGGFVAGAVALRILAFLLQVKVDPASDKSKKTPDVRAGPAHKKFQSSYRSRKKKGKK